MQVWKRHFVKISFVFITCFILNIILVPPHSALTEICPEIPLGEYASYDLIAVGGMSADNFFLSYQTGDGGVLRYDGSSFAEMTLSSGNNIVDIAGNLAISSNKIFLYDGENGWDEVSVSAASPTSFLVPVYHLLLLTSIPPVVITQAATGISPTGATLKGKVKPNGDSTTAHFQWGETTSYGQTTADQGMGSGTTAVSLSQTLSNLTCNTTYHYRAVGTNNGGTTYGEDQIFATGGCEPENGEELDDTISELNEFEIAWEVGQWTYPSAIRKSIPDTYPDEVSDILAAGQSAGAKLTEEFRGTAFVDQDASLCIFSYLIEQLNYGDAVPVLADWLEENMIGDVLRAPDCVTHALKVLSGQRRLNTASYTYPLAEMLAAVQDARASGNSLTAQTESVSKDPVMQGALLAINSKATNSCRNFFKVEWKDGGAHPGDLPIYIEGTTEFVDLNDPAFLEKFVQRYGRLKGKENYDKYIEEQRSADASRFKKPPYIWISDISNRNDCAGGSLEVVAGLVGERGGWNSKDPGDALAIAEQFGTRRDSLEDAQGRDMIIIFQRPDGSVPHVAYVDRVETVGGSKEVVIRTKDSVGSTWEAMLGRDEGYEFPKDDPMFQHPNITEDATALYFEIDRSELKVTSVCLTKADLDKAKAVVSISPSQIDDAKAGYTYTFTADKELTPEEAENYFDSFTYVWTVWNREDDKVEYLPTRSGNVFTFTFDNPGYYYVDVFLKVTGVGIPISGGHATAEINVAELEFPITLTATGTRTLTVEGNFPGGSAENVQSIDVAITLYESGVIKGKITTPDGEEVEVPVIGGEPGETTTIIEQKQRIKVKCPDDATNNAGKTVDVVVWSYATNGKEWEGEWYGDETDGTYDMKRRSVYYDQTIRGFFLDSTIFGGLAWPEDVDKYPRGYPSSTFICSSNKTTVYSKIEWDF